MNTKKTAGIFAEINDYQMSVSICKCIQYYTLFDFIRYVTKSRNLSKNPQLKTVLKVSD